MKDLMQELRQKVTFESIKNRIDTKKDVISREEFMIETKNAPLKELPYATQGRVSSIDDVEKLVSLVFNDEGVKKFISKYERIVFSREFGIDKYDGMLYLLFVFYPN